MSASVGAKCTPGGTCLDLDGGPYGRYRPPRRPRKSVNESGRTREAEARYNLSMKRTVDDLSGCWRGRGSWSSFAGRRPPMEAGPALTLTAEGDEAVMGRDWQVRPKERGETRHATWAKGPRGTNFIRFRSSSEALHQRHRADKEKQRLVPLSRLRLTWRAGGSRQTSGGLGRAVSMHGYARRKSMEDLARDLAYRATGQIGESDPPRSTDVRNGSPHGNARMSPAASESRRRSAFRNRDGGRSTNMTARSRCADVWSPTFGTI